jgi:hypothetical protein
MKNEQDGWEYLDFPIAGILRLKLEKDSPTDHPLILRVNMHDDGAVTFNAYPNHKGRYERRTR